MKKKQVNYSAPALEKGLDIIELLAITDKGLTQAEIALKLKRSVNEIYRMLNILIKRNYIETDPKTDIYTLTYKLLDISIHQQPVKNLIDRSTPLMRELSHICNQSIHLSIYSAGKLLVIGQEDSPSSFNYAISVGSNFDLLETSSGRVLLTFQNLEERNRRLQRRKLFIKFEKNYHLSNIQLKFIEKKYSTKTIHEITKNGYEVVESLQIAGITNISAPVFDQTGYAISAITIPYLNRINSKKDLSITDCTKLLKKYCQKLSSSLGYDERRNKF